MAKKKGKKNAQKQVEVASPPDNVEPASAVATEESPANEATPEAQEPLLAPLLAASNDQVPAGPTSMPDPNLEHIQVEPRENEVPSVKDEVPPPLEPDHVDATPTSPEQNYEVPATELQEPSQAQDADPREISSAQPSVIEAIEPSDAKPIDIADSQLDAPIAAAPTDLTATAPTDSKSDDLLDGEPQAIPDEDQAADLQTELFSPVEPQPTIVSEDLLHTDQARDVDVTGAEVPVAVDVSDETPSLEVSKVTESFIDENDQLIRHDSLAAPIQDSVVVDPPQPEVLEAPLVQSSNHSVLESATQQSFQAEEVDASPKVAEEQVQPLETVSSADIPTSAHLPSTVPSKEPSVDARELLHDESLLMNTPEPSQHYDSRPPQISTPPIIEQVQAESEAPIIESDVPPLKKETSKQRRRREAEETMQREAEETMQREEQARLDQESFEQYRIDQERLEMARLEQKRLEREKARQERRRKEQIEQERFEKEQVEQERLEAERREREQLERERLEQDRLVREILEKEKLEKQRREKERLENERLEMERLEKERLEKEKLEKELLEQARMEQQRLEHQRLEREKIEQERLDQERLDAQRIQEEMNENKRLEQERIDNEVLEQQRLDKEAEADADRAELARKQILETEAARITKEHEVQIQEFAEKIAAEVNVEHPTSSSASSVLRQKAVLESPTAPTHRATPPPEARSRPPPASSAVRTSNPVSRLPTPAASAGRTSSPRSVASDTPRARTYASEAPPQTVPAHRPEDLHQMSNGRHASGSPALPAPRPQAVSQIIEENRPPAPSPPVARARPRHIPAFDSEDDSDSALVRPRRHFRGGEDYDGSSGAGQGYAQPAHHRSVFASRVPPAEPSVPSYSNPPPPQPPGYHPGYYPPTAPPHYQNHNYRVSQQGYPPPNPYGPSSHSSSSPYTEPWNYPQGYRHDSPPQRHDTLVTRDYPLGLAPIDTRSPLGDDPGDVFSRISQAIPDLHVLLARYKETHGQLSVREELLRRSAVEQEERLRVKDDEIADLKERNRSQEHRFSTEASRLRLQIGDLEEQARELQQQRAETDRFKREAYDTRNAFDAAMRSWETKYKELEEAHAAQARAAAEEKADLDAWKSSYTTRNDAEKIALAIHFDTRLKEADVLAENKRQEAVTAFILEKDELRSDLLRKQQEQQAGFERVRNELETKLRAAQMDREESLRSEREGREVWLAEREALIKSHQDDRESILKGLDEQRDLLDAQYKNSRDEENARVAQLVMDMEELQRKYDALRTESEKEKAIIKSVASNLESEKSRLEKLMECYGDIAEIKSKGDTYYLVSFSQLQKQIIDLATTHFVHLPVRPPAEDLAQVPSNLPSFLGDTVASRQVRAAYVAHTVSKLITYRVFGPFLFSLGRRYDKADSLFLSMSHHIRDKSTRKEAIWRQQTLLAAFTSSGAKQRINTAAGTVVEEIVSAIKHFADPREEEGIKIAVKRIVKLAAETWRFARLEREMINATMPALLDEEHQFTGPEFWPSYESYKPEGTLIGSLVGTSPPSNDQPQLLLRLFPVIWRESKHENFHGDGEKPDTGCIFHHGLALYDDAEPVAQRMEELKSAGLPSYTTTTTPTIAESGKFPPPIVPPPREALPHPPATTENSDQSAKKSTPSSPTDFLDKSSSRSTTPPPPPSSIRSLELPTPSLPVKAYQRPPPGPIDFASPRDLIGLPPPVESMVNSQAPSRRHISEPPPASAAARSRIPVSTVHEPTNHPPPPPSAPPPPPPVSTQTVEHRRPTTAESSVLPPEMDPSEDKGRDPPTPPHSRSGTPTERPVSPLFEAVDEIESLQSHRSRHPSVSMKRRRSTHSRRSKDEMPEVNPTTDRADTNRRTSGYALSTRSAKTVDTERTDRTDKSDKTDRTDKSERDPKSRYMCESRSAAVKALYPNSPLAGQGSGGSSKNSVSSSKKKDRSSKELKREKSFPDNGTWDTTSIFTTDATDVQPPKKKDRSSKELKREKSIPDNGTWDTSSNLTSEATNTQLSTNDHAH